MKLLLSVLALETASKEMGIRYCGQMKGQSGHLQDELSLSENESCLYHIEPDQPAADGDYHIELTEVVLPLCSVSEMFIHQDGQVFGPYCNQSDMAETRHRRAGWMNKWNGPTSLPSKPFDVIYTGHGLKFSFDFEFDMAPGLPRTKSLTFENQDKFGGSAFSMKEQILNQIKGAKPIPVKPVMMPTRAPIRTFKPTYKPHFKPTMKPIHSSAYNHKEHIISSISPAQLPKPQEPTGGFASALDTKETILQTLNVQENTAFEEKEQIYALAENLGVDYSVSSTTKAPAQTPTQAPATVGQIDLGLIDQIVDQSKPESDSAFVYQGYSVDSYLNSGQNTAQEKDSLIMDLVEETTTIFNEDVTYRLDTSTINPPRYTTPAPRPSTTVASPMKPSIKPLPDRELNFVFNRPRPNLPEPIISAAQPITKPVPEKKPALASDMMNNNINFGMERPNPIMRMDSIAHPVPHLPALPLETMLVIATTTEPPQVTPSTLAKIPRGHMSVRRQLATVLFEADGSLTMEEYINGVDMLKLEHMSMETVGKINDKRKKGLTKRIRRRLDHQRLNAERLVRKEARNEERRNKKAARKSG